MLLSTRIPGELVRITYADHAAFYPTRPALSSCHANPAVNGYDMAYLE